MATAVDGQVAVECHEVVKRFYHYEHRTSTLQEFFVRSVLRKPMHVRRPLFQLSGFSLQVMQGESVALLGSNGSGKSTALRLMAGIYPPTEGTVAHVGRLIAVIELGATFQPELTADENVSLYAAALGLTPGELAARREAIFDFAGVTDFRGVALKYFSSGMRSRLAFAIATWAEPDTLLLDEVLAVGDAEFRGRCLGRLRDFHSGGGTLIIVSHDLETVRSLCTRGIWLEKGRVRKTGDIHEVIDAYQAQVAS